MGAYSYRALNERGRVVKGVVEGDSERQVRGQLRASQLKVIEVKAAASRQQPEASGGSWRLGLLRKINHRDRTLITRQLASLISSGLPLDECLKATARQQRKSHVKEILLQVRARIVEGNTLARALAESPGSFDEMYRALVRAGETAGYLGPVMEQLADHTEASHYAQQRLRMAMIYPLVLLSVSVLVIGLLMTFVVPKITGIFAHSQRELPALTEALIGLSHFAVDYGLWLLVAVIALIVGLRRILQVPRLRLHWHRCLLRIPILRGIIIESNSARFAATLGLLVSSGVPLLDALRIAGQVLSNLVMRNAASDAALAVQEGGSLNKALDQSGLFPPLLVQMVSIGEANGALAEQLGFAARNQQRELELMLATALGIMEPMTVVVLGGIVTAIVLAILLPIFELNTLI